MEITTVAGYMAEKAVQRIITTSGTITLNIPRVGELVTLDEMSEKAYLITNVTLECDKTGIYGYATLMLVDHEDEELSDIRDENGKSEIHDKVTFDRFELSELI